MPLTGTLLSSPLTPLSGLPRWTPLIVAFAALALDYAPPPPMPAQMDALILSSDKSIATPANWPNNHEEAGMKVIDGAGA